MRRSLDTTDLRLIRRLQETPRASYAELARAIGTSETTVRRRVDWLIDSQIITPAMIPNIRRLGYETVALVGLNVDLNHLYEVAERVREFSEVTMVHLTLGRYDLMIAIAQPTLDEVTHFLIENVAPLQGVRATETFVSSRSLKMLRDWRVPDERLKIADDGHGLDEVPQPTS